MLWVPTASKAVSKVAVRVASSVAVPKLVMPSRNTTVPLRVFGAFTFWPGDVTVAENRTVRLARTWEGVAVRAVLVG